MGMFFNGGGHIWEVRCVKEIAIVRLTWIHKVYVSMRNVVMLAPSTIRASMPHNVLLQYVIILIIGKHLIVLFCVDGNLSKLYFCTLKFDKPLTFVCNMEVFLVKCITIIFVSYHDSSYSQCIRYYATHH